MLAESTYILHATLQSRYSKQVSTHHAKAFAQVDPFLTQSSTKMHAHRQPAHNEIFYEFLSGFGVNS